MVTKLVQKHLLRGTQEFEIVDDAVKVYIKTPFKKEESLTVMLTVLNPEPLIRKSRLEFTSRVNNEPLLSLYLAKPNAEEFNVFVNLLKQKAQEEFNAFAGLKSVASPGLKGNVFEAPPEFESSESQRSTKISKPVNVEYIEEAIAMLSQYMEAEKIGPLLSAMEALRADPQKESLLSKLIEEFDALGPHQGAVLTYAPYIGILMSDSLFGN